MVGRTTSQWLDDPGGALLQVLPGAERPVATLSYTQGDLLVLYSDGLIERRRESLDIGLARLESAGRRQFDRDVSIQAVADGLLRDLLPVPSDDDVVLVTNDSSSTDHEGTSRRTSHWSRIDGGQPDSMMCRSANVTER